MKENKTREWIVRIMNEFKEGGKSDELINQYNKMDYELQCSIKGAVKKLGKTSFGYYQSL